MKTMFVEPEKYREVLLEKARQYRPGLGTRPRRFMEKMEQNIGFAATSNQAIQKYLTPYRCPFPALHGSGQEGAFDCKGVDVPFVFWHDGRYHMLYVGFDGIGYQTALAVSEDLLHWSHKGVVLKRDVSGGRWDGVSRAGCWIIKESDSLWELPRLRKIHGRYWMVYHAYPGNGYECGPAEIGLAWSEDEELLQWNLLETPVFSWRDGKDWEAGGLYKSCIVEKDGIFYMFYNAKNREKDWQEQIGLVTSEDLFHWHRAEENPILSVSPGAWDGIFVSDPCVVRDGDLWLNFYYGLGEAGADQLRHAQEGLAFSRDLLHWEKVPWPILSCGSAGDLDCGHAHKPSLIYADGVLYHFYCGTRPWRKGDPTNLEGEYRTICVAASKEVFS